MPIGQCEIDLVIWRSMRKGGREKRGLVSLFLSLSLSLSLRAGDQSMAGHPSNRPIEDAHLFVYPMKTPPQSKHATRRERLCPDGGIPTSVRAYAMSVASGPRPRFLKSATSNPSPRIIQLLSAHITRPRSKSWISRVRVRTKGGNTRI
ncbi:hypothetical protein LY76DRAFT_182273 [Colletotrichum caudatum]|nr:hypothetical protein LY76DRAFT_182273 [Colletotrichum caudatum]